MPRIFCFLFWVFVFYLGGCQARQPWQNNARMLQMRFASIVKNGGWRRWFRERMGEREKKDHRLEKISQNPESRGNHVNNTNNNNCRRETSERW